MCGFIILLGVFICSPITSFFALLGSTIGALSGIALGASPDAVYAGLWGFNTTLTTVAIGGMFFIMNRFGTFVYTIIAGMLTTIVFGACKTIAGTFGVPTLTFPFCFVSWIFCLAGMSVGCVFPVLITAI